jgi:hypothetical protein
LDDGKGLRGRVRDSAEAQGWLPTAETIDMGLFAGFLYFLLSATSEPFFDEGTER